MALPDHVPLQKLRETLWWRGDLEFLLWPQQIPIWNQLKNLPISIDEFVVLCARQLGKSTIGIIYALSEAIKNKDCCILIMGPDTKQICDIVGPKMRFLTRTAPKGLIKPMRSLNRWHIYHNGNQKSQDYTEIVLGGMNENSSSQRGKTVHKILVEEIVDVPEDNFITSMRSDLGPALTHSKDGKIIFLTTLPKYPAHPFIAETIPKAKINNALALYDIYANTKLSPEQFQKCVDLAGGMESDDFRREYLCQIVRDTKLVCLPDFDKSSVLAFDLPLYCKIFVTIDWGGVRDKTCALMHTYDYYNDTDLFWDERVFGPNNSTRVIVDACKEMEGKREIEARFIDAPHQLVAVDLIKEFNYQARLPQKSDWQASLNTLNGRFKAGKVKIHSRCKFLAVSCESGILNKTRTDFDRNDALGHMDALAAMMYAVRMRNTDNPYPKVFNDPYLQVRPQPANLSSIGTGKTTKAFGQFAKGN